MDIRKITRQWKKNKHTFIHGYHNKMFESHCTKLNKNSGYIKYLVMCGCLHLLCENKILSGSTLS